MNKHDADYLSLALELAKRGRFTVSPNPMVGCVLVREGQIVGQGYHQKAGEPHAEVYALREAGELAAGATAYVSLEPCCHWGRTPPCTDALIKAGIQRVVVGSVDPNPLVGGKGIEQLRAAGIEVVLSANQEPAQKLNQIFFHYIKHQRPFVISKWAMSLDGKTSVNAGDSPRISGTDSQVHTHELRQAVDAILVGAGTARMDNPQLTVRADRIAKHPLRVILEGREPLSKSLRLFNGSLPGKTLLVTSLAQQVEIFNNQDGVEVLLLQGPEPGCIPLLALLQELGRRSISSILVEGGETLHRQFFAENLVNQVQVTLAPVYIGALAQKQVFEVSEQKQLGSDFHITLQQEDEIHV